MDFIFESFLPIAAMLMVLIITIVFMLGRVFRIPAWEAYLNVELYNLLFMLILITGMTGVYSVLNSIANTLNPNSGEIVEGAQKFLHRVLAEGVLPMYSDLLVMETLTSMSNSFYLLIGPGVWSYTEKVVPGADAILSIVRIMMMGLLAIYVSLITQYMGLAFVDFLMPIMLSLGIFLYIFPPTREAGAFLISFAFAFRVVLPFIYAVGEHILDDMWVKHNYGNYFNGYIPETLGMRIRGLSSIKALIVPFATYFNLIALAPYFKAMSYLTLVAIFLPALAMLLSIGVMNSTIKFILGRTT